LQKIAYEEQYEAQGVGAPEPMYAMFPFIPDDWPEANEGQRVEQQYLQVEVHGRMLREEHAEQQYSRDGIEAAD